MIALQRVFVGELDSLSVIMADRQVETLIQVNLILIGEIVALRVSYRVIGENQHEKVDGDCD